MRHMLDKGYVMCAGRRMVADNARTNPCGKQQKQTTSWVSKGYPKDHTALLRC